MKNHLMVFLLVCTSMSGLCQNLNQVVIASAGKSSQNQSVQLDWTIGEVFINTIISNKCIISQGFHQTNLILSSSREAKHPGLSVRIYPNPASEYIMINCWSLFNEYLLIELIDMNGRIKFFDKTNDGELKIDIRGFDKGFYFLRLYDENRNIIGSYKIIKLGY